MKALNFLRRMMRFGAWALVIFDILEFAVDKIEPLVKGTNEKDKKDEVVSE